jgi:2-aminoethylphosphonate-pyruvate transaminase
MPRLIEDLLLSVKDPLLFTPGPLTTSDSVKRAMLRDLGSRDEAFLTCVEDVRRGLLDVGGVSQASGWEAVPVQGCGTYGLEAAVSSLVPASGGLLVASNGHYAERLAVLANAHGIPCERLDIPEDQALDPGRVEEALRARPDLTHLAFVHCETSTGLLNPVEEVAAVARSLGRGVLLDSMSAYGGLPLSLAESSVDILISSSNKCIQGVPGFSFVLCRRDLLEASAGQARTLSFDLHAQWRALEKNGQFRFTPPTHVFLAFDEALRELAEEGGVAGRHARYQSNHDRLLEGTRALGLVEYLRPELQSCIITSFVDPPDPAYDFERFYELLKDDGLVIYPGKLTRADSFRIGTIGHLFPDDVGRLVDAMGRAFTRLGVGRLS